MPGEEISGGRGRQPFFLPGHGTGGINFLPRNDVALHLFVLRTVYMLDESD
jgi:hypothetical protein